MPKNKNPKIPSKTISNPRLKNNQTFSKSKKSLSHGKKLSKKEESPKILNKKQKKRPQ